MRPARKRSLGGNAVLRLIGLSGRRYHREGFRTSGSNGGSWFGSWFLKYDARRNPCTAVRILRRRSRVRCAGVSFLSGNLNTCIRSSVLCIYSFALSQLRPNLVTREDGSMFYGLRHILQPLPDDHDVVIIDLTADSLPTVKQGYLSSGATAHEWI